MPINPFKLERYFARYEFSVKFLLSSSDCESLTLAELLEMASPASRELWAGLKLSYTESQGHPLLREAVAGLYTGILPENVLIAVPEEAIFVAMQTLLAPGDHVIAVSPAYQSLTEIAVSLGCTVTPWRLEAASGGWRLNLETLSASLTEKTRLLVLNFPNNPTGFLPTRAEFDAILALARRHGLTVFSDEMYRLLEPDSALRLPSVAEVYENGVALSGLSKAFALPGLRMGWLTTQKPELIQRWLAFKDYTTICHSAPSEILALMALENTERITARNREIIRENLAAAETFFAVYADWFEWLPPQAGSIAFLRWQGRGPVEQFCDELVQAEGVLLVPGSLFDFPGGYVRVGLGRKNFREGLEHLAAYLDAAVLKTSEV
jgi:aspartate/methionine/tyrosine aminotransferase